MEDLKKIKVLYVCPFAHYSGHHPHVAYTEPEQLVNAGVDVTLLTFSGIINGAAVNLRHEKVLNGHSVFQGILQRLRLNTLLRWMIMFWETVETLNVAVQMYKIEKYDIIHLRDGEPFLFLSHLMSLPYKGIKWVVSLTATLVFKPDTRDSKLFVRLYSLCLSLLVNNRLWKLLYKRSLKRNSFIYTPQNELATEAYKKYMDGIFDGRVKCVELGVDSGGDSPSKEDARDYLDLPQEAFVVLSFGASHPGKDMETIFKAIQVLDVHLVHAGTHTYSLGGNPLELTRKYNLDGKVTISDYFIPEEEKPYYFGAADIIVLSYKKAFASTSSMIWEAAKYRKPVVCSDANTLGNDVKKYGLGLLFEAENYQSLIEVINNYKQMSMEAIDEIEDNCSVFANDYSDTKWAEKYKAIYKGLLC